MAGVRDRTRRATARLGDGMRYVRCALALGLLTVISPSAVVLAQPATIAVEGTVGSFRRAVESATRAARLADTLPAFQQLLLRQLAVLDRRTLDSIPLDAVGREWMSSATNRAPLSRVARWRPRDPMALLSAAEQIAIDSAAFVSLQLLPDLLDARLPEDSVDVLLAPISAFDRARRIESLAQSVEKLRRYERKFGPTSARLNVVEVGLNFVAQSLPPFRPSADGWPSPFEVVAAYVPTYGTVHDGRATAWTVLEVGLRYYVFDERWGQSGLAGLLRPSQLAMGVAVVNADGGALQEPWRDSPRVGGFVSWGGVKLAIVGGNGPNLLITRQFQVIPFAF